MEVSVDFILDDLSKFIKHNQERYPLSVYGDPVLESNAERVDDYITVWPCKSDRITIKVQLDTCFTALLSIHKCQRLLTSQKL